jgi:hypothetical protein
MAVALKVFLLAVIQGVTEFLPVSSSGHLVIAGTLMGFEAEENVHLAIVLHAGSLVSIAAYYWREIWRIVREFDWKMVLMLGIGTVPAVIVGLSLKLNHLDDRMENIWVASAGLLVTAAGVLGSSSGGHVAQLLGMRPRDPRYNAHPLPEAPNVDAKLAYVATRSPISDPYARFLQAEKMKRAEMMQKSKTYFNPWDAVYEGNPQQILDRREAVSLPPMLIMQGALDDNVIPPIQEKFAATYRAAGGECQLDIFEGSTHEWVAEPGPQTDRAHEMVKAFIARQLGALRRAA